MVWPRPQNILENHSRHVDALRWAGASNITANGRSVFYLWSRDALERVTRKLKEGIARRFRKLHREFEGRVRLDDILDAWRDEVGSKQNFGRLKGLYKHRHWLAHGRHWVDKSGFAVAPDPGQAWLFAEPCLEAIRAALPSFPLI